MKPTKESLMLSGQTLYLREHTEETRKLRRTITYLFLILFGLLLLGFWYVQHYRIIAYPVAMMREIISKCVLK